MSSPTQPAAPQQTEGQAGYSHRQILVILMGLMLGMFLAALDQTIVSTAIRTIADDLNGFSLQVWATTAFLITSTISTPLYGKLSDLYGRKPFFLFAITVFIIGSALCGLSQSMWQLAGFRAIQGIGAGGLFSLALTIIGDIVPPRQRARYQGYFLAVFGTSSVLGPVLGGLFAGAETIGPFAGWRWIFYINVPIGLAALVVVQRVLQLQHTPRHHRIDWPGALALIVCLVPLLTVAEQGRTWGWDSGRSVLCYVVGLIGLAAFLLAERAYGDDALLPLRLFRGRTFAVASISSFILGIGMFGAILVLPLYLQIVKGYEPTAAGLATLPLVLGIMAGSVISGQTISRTGKYRVFPIIGTALMVVALLLFTRIGADTPLWQTMLIMPIMGLGLGGNMQPIVLATQNAVSPREIGVATSSVTFFRQMGGTLGAALFLSVLFSLLPGRITSAVTAAEGDPAFQQALRDDPTQAAQLQNLDLDDTSFISRLSDVVAHPFKVGFSDSMSVVFLIGALVVAVGLVVVWFLPQLELTDRSASQARADETQAEAIAEEAAAAAAVSAPTSSAPTAAPTAAGLQAAGTQPDGGLPPGSRPAGDPRPGSRPDGTPRDGTQAAGSLPETSLPDGIRPDGVAAGKHEANGDTDEFRVPAETHDGDGRHAAPDADGRHPAQDGVVRPPGR